jgi:putative transcriptional regulator
MTKTYRSKAFAAIHETMEALHEVGAIDKQTMRELDDPCLTPVQPLAPEEIRAIREREHLSQPVFARYLNVSKNLALIGSAASRSLAGLLCACSPWCGKKAFRRSRSGLSPIRLATSHRIGGGNDVGSNRSR